MEIRQYYEQGMNKSEMSRMLNVDRKTIRKYATEVSPPTYKKRAELQPLLDPYKDYLEQRLAECNVSAKRLFLEVQQQGYQGGYSWLSSYVGHIKQTYQHQAILRFETLPGEQAQVDWGYLGEIFDREKQHWIKLYCFFMVLGYSRMLYAEVFEHMRMEHFLQAHNHAFSYFGGYTREILYDNLKSVVIKRAFFTKDSEFNKKFMDFAGFYGFKPILCRPYKPNTKGKVENSVHFVKQNFYSGKHWSSLTEINEHLLLWLKEVSHRIHATVREKPIDRWKRETLLPLKNKFLYDLTPYYFRKVSRDCFFSFEGSFYSVPFEYAGKEITVKKKHATIEIFYRNQRIAEHELAKKKGEFIRKTEHFQGLLENRCRHRLRKPKKKKKASLVFIPIKPSYSPCTPTVVERELASYEEVT